MPEKSHEVVSPLYNFDWLGKKKIEDWDGREDLNSIGLNEYVISENRIKLRQFSFAEEYPPIDNQFFSPHDIGQLEDTKWALSASVCKDNKERIYQEMNLLLIAFRVYLKASCSIRHRYCITNPSWDEKYIEPMRPAIYGERYSREFSINEIESLKTGFLSLLNLKFFNDRTSEAMNFLFLGYTTYYYLAAFMHFIIALEILYLHPSKNYRITPTLSERIPEFIKDEKVANSEYVEEIFSLRSKIAHGKIDVKVNFDDFLPTLQKLQRVLLSTIKKILSENLVKRIYNDPTGKELFFNGL